MADIRSPGGLGEPATHGFAIVPHDNNELLETPRAIYVGVAGTVRMALKGGDEVTLVGAAAGTILAVRPKKVFSTGTTATDLVALY